MRWELEEVLGCHRAFLCLLRRQGDRNVAPPWAEFRSQAFYIALFNIFATPT